MYVCPRCKEQLAEFTCSRCQKSYPVVKGIPCFLVGSPEEIDHRIREIYDEIYQHHEDVWIDQGRSARFQQWFSDLAASYSTGPLLEIGCGEGILLSAFRSDIRVGIDPSVVALTRAKARSASECAVARAEELPFESASFQIVASVGVMEHFDDPDAAAAEIHRVLAPSGTYIALFHRDMSRAQRLQLKAKEFLWPPRPAAFVRWIRKKLFHPIVQPLRKSYSIESTSAILQRHGFKVTDVIVGGEDRSTPLAGPHVVIVTARKMAAA